MIELRLCLRTHSQQTRSLLAALQSLARLARLARGCLEVHLFTESQDPRNLCYTEAWDTEENLCSMLCSEHFTRLAELMETAVEPPVLDFRTITAIRGLEFAQQARQDQNEGVFTLDSGDDSYP
jgi:quinol monooxygenase YgiN